MKTEAFQAESLGSQDLAFSLGWVYIGGVEPTELFSGDIDVFKIHQCDRRFFPGPAGDG